MCVCGGGGVGGGHTPLPLPLPPPPPLPSPSPPSSSASSSSPPPPAPLAALRPLLSCLPSGEQQSALGGSVCAGRSLLALCCERGTRLREAELHVSAAGLRSHRRGVEKLAEALRKDARFYHRLLRLFSRHIGSFLSEKGQFPNPRSRPVFVVVVVCFFPPWI